MLKQKHFLKKGIFMNKLRRTKFFASVYPVDIVLMLFLLVLLIHAGVSLFSEQGVSQERTTIDIIVRTSAAAIFGYFLSAPAASASSGTTTTGGKAGRAFALQSSQRVGHISRPYRLMWAYCLIRCIIRGSHTLEPQKPCRKTSAVFLPSFSRGGNNQHCAFVRESSAPRMHSWIWDSFRRRHFGLSSPSSSSVCSARLP